MSWAIIDSGKRSAEENMAIDTALLLDLENSKEPILHLYDWEGESATYGHFVDPIKFLNFEAVVSHKLHLAKRPTGGGIVFHNCDLAFSVLVPASHPSFSQNPLDNYTFVNQQVLWAIGQFIGEAPELLQEEIDPPDVRCSNFCMAKPTKYDVMLRGRKVGGAAQRKTRHGYLHQGSISLGLLPQPYLEDLLGPGSVILAEMKRQSLPLLGEKWTKKELADARLTLRSLLKKAFLEGRS